MQADHQPIAVPEPGALQPGRHPVHHIRELPRTDALLTHRQKRPAVPPVAQAIQQVGDAVAGLGHSADARAASGRRRREAAAGMVSRRGFEPLLPE